MGSVAARSSLCPRRRLLLVAVFALVTVLGHVVGASAIQGHHSLPAPVAASSFSEASGPQSLDGSLDRPVQAVAGSLQGHEAEIFACGALILSLLVLLLLRRGGSSNRLNMPRTRSPAWIRPGGQSNNFGSSHQKRLAVLSVSRC